MHRNSETLHLSLQLLQLRFFRPRLGDEVGLDLGKNVNPRNTACRLHAVHVVTPPRTSRPPNSAKPDIRVLSKIRETVLKSCNALGVVTTSKLANDTLLLVVLEPLSRSLETLLEDGGRDAVCRGTGAVGVEVLVHLVDELVLGIFQVDEGRAIAGRNPGPGASVRVALRGDVLLGGAGSADAIDGGLVEVEDESLVHVVVLIVCVKDDERIVLVLCGNVLPPCLEAGGVGNDVAVEAAVVVRLDHGVCALAGDVVDLLGEIAEIGL